MMEGQTNKEIASRVMLQEITVKVHLRNHISQDGRRQSHAGRSDCS